ncbi:hypothetical protein Mgra_00004908 [Meloidogyne graminicola]|uniref:Uncharacterized protein n=1 Tax=Meloidogyne graminicola TaxID=189291 RepID=A0A8S9ZRI1_9BILA|nr:hypothetical protein Mgra_00004908 [Meloidogyne graminicola]
MSSKMLIINSFNNYFLLFLTIFQYYSMALYIINPEELIAMKQANDELDEIELESRWRSLQRALQGRLNDLIEKERFISYSSQNPYDEQKNEIIINKRQPPLMFIEPLKEEYENGEDFMNENENNEQPLMLVIEQQRRKPEIEEENELLNKNLMFLPSWE